MPQESLDTGGTRKSFTGWKEGEEQAFDACLLFQYGRSIYEIKTILLDKSMPFIPTLRPIHKYHPCFM